MELLTARRVNGAQWRSGEDSEETGGGASLFRAGRGFPDHICLHASLRGGGQDKTAPAEAGAVEELRCCKRLGVAATTAGDAEDAEEARRHERVGGRFGDRGDVRAAVGKARWLGAVERRVRQGLLPRFRDFDFVEIRARVEDKEGGAEPVAATHELIEHTTAPVDANQRGTIQQRREVNDIRARSAPIGSVTGQLIGVRSTREAERGQCSLHRGTRRRPLHFVSAPEP